MRLTGLPEDTLLRDRGGSHVSCQFYFFFLGSSFELEQV
jgi:hypothetical protein